MNKRSKPLIKNNYQVIDHDCGAIANRALAPPKAPNSAHAKPAPG